MKKPASRFQVMEGDRAALERELLRALFLPDGERRARELRQRLAPRGKGRLRAIRDASHAAAAAPTVDDVQHDPPAPR